MAIDGSSVAAGKGLEITTPRSTVEASCSIVYADVLRAWHDAVTLAVPVIPTTSRVVVRLGVGVQREPSDTVSTTRSTPSSWQRSSRSGSAVAPRRLSERATAAARQSARLTDAARAGSGEHGGCQPLLTESVNGNRIFEPEFGNIQAGILLISPADPDEVVEKRRKPDSGLRGPPSGDERLGGGSFVLEEREHGVGVEDRQ
jgi:hypothetical protein